MLKKVFLLLTILITLLLVIKIIEPNSDASTNLSTSKAKNSFFGNSQNKPAHHDVNSQPRLAQKHPIGGTMILPWRDDLDDLAGEYYESNQILQNLTSAGRYASISDFSDEASQSSAYQAEKTETFTSGILVNESSSGFVCPSNLPYAVNFKFTNPPQNQSDTSSFTESQTIYARGYMNSCGYGAAPKPDLLYGQDQYSETYGNAKNMTAFVPSSLPEGCGSGVSAKQPVIFKIRAVTTESPTLMLMNRKYHVVGYTQQTIVSPVDCNKVCNTMLDYYCNADPEMGYCGEIVLDAYRISSTYKARNLPEDFCSCKVKFLTYDGAFTNAVDIESAVKYNNPLKSVTCSNLPSD